MTRHHPIDLDSLEDDIGRLASMGPGPLIEIAPAPVQHRDISKLSADVVLEQYRLAAKAIEDMGQEVQKRAAALDAASAVCVSDMKLLKEAAEMVVEKGKLAHAEIERTTAVSNDIREVVAAIKAKLA